MEAVADILEKDAVKFLLPNCCNLIDAESYSGEHYKLLKTPYPVTAFEAPWILSPEDNLVSKLDTHLSTRRIALVIEADHECLTNIPYLTGMDQYGEGAWIISIFYIDKQWRLNTGAIFLPYNQPDKSVVEAPDPVSAKLQAALLGSGRAKSSNFTCETDFCFMLPELSKMLISQQGEEAAKLDLVYNARDEVDMVMQACAVINCENIIVEELAVPKRLQAARKKRGKTPLVEYKVLGIGAHSYKQPSGQSRGKTAKKRMHLRRGHIRRFKNGSMTWIRHSIVNPGAKARIEKTYKVRH